MARLNRANPLVWVVQPAGSDGSHSQFDVIQWEKIAIRIRELLIQGRKTRQSGQKPFVFYGLDNQAIILTPHDGLLRAIDLSMDAFMCPIGLR